MWITLLAFHVTINKQFNILIKIESMRKKQIITLIIALIVAIGVLGYYGSTQASVVNSVQTFAKDVLFKGVNNVFEKGIRVGKTGTGAGGVAFLNGTIINDSVGSNGQNKPVTIGDNLRIDGNISRGSAGGDPIKVDDTIIPVRTNLYSIGSANNRFKNGFFSDTIAANILTISSIGSSGVITTDNLSAGAVTGDIIASGTILTGNVASSAITTGKLADSAVTSAKILDGTIATADLADDAVTTDKILDLTIVAGNLASDSVTSAKILDGTITGSDISGDANLSISSLSSANLYSSKSVGIGVAAPGLTGYLQVSNSIGVGTTASGIAGDITATRVGAGTAPSYSLHVSGVTNGTAYFAPGNEKGVGIGIAPGSYYLQVVDNGTGSGNAGAIYAELNTTVSVDIQAAIVGANTSTVDNTDKTIGVLGISYGVNSGSGGNVGVYGVGDYNTILNIGVIGESDGGALTNYGILGQVNSDGAKDMAGFFKANKSASPLVNIRNDSIEATADGLQIQMGPNGTSTAGNRFIDFQTNDGTSIGSVQGSGAPGGVVYQTTGADLAEYFPATESIESGILVSLGRDGKMTKTISGNKPFGVVSTAPAFVGGNNTPNSILVALLGQVPTKVNNENGAIVPGDKIAVSSMAGVGRKAKDGESFVGIALESFSGAEGQIKVLVSALANY